MNIWYPIVIVAFLAMVSVSSHAYASTCAVKQTTLTTPQQFYRVSDVVFVGTISEINNYTNQQYKIQFDAEKIWKGAQTTKITLTVGSLQACGYSLVKDEKYLVFANGSPPSLDLVLTKPFTEAQDFISVYNDTQFQSEESAKESMIKRLENAKDAISAMMGSHNTSGIPFNMVGVDVLNATLDVGIDSSKATLTKAGYEEKIKGLVGDLPMNVEFMQIWPTTGNTSHEQITNSTSNDHPVLHVDVKYILRSPLQQFKSGIKAEDVKCKEGFQLVIKSEDGSPICVKPDDAYILIYRGWAKEFIQSVTWTNQSTCKGTEVLSGDYRRNIFPVLIMSQNSTATVCVTYNFVSDWKSYHNKDVYPHGILETCCFVHPGWYSSPVSSNKFEIIADPPLFNVTNVNKGSKISVTYKIYAKSDSKGFYDTSVPFDDCLSYPLAVGYSPSEVNATKFHADFAIPCFASIDNVDSVNIVSGMTYKEVQFP